MNVQRAMYIQTLLRNSGVNIIVDGVWGRDSQSALDSFAISNGMTISPPEVLTSQVLKLLQSSPISLNEDLNLFSPENVERLMELWYITPNSARSHTFKECFSFLNDNQDTFKLNSFNRQVHFIAQIRQETGSRFTLVESLNYSCTSLPKVFSYYRRNPSEAYSDGRCNGHSADQRTIAIKAYGNRGNNNSLSDGWKFRGRGMKQLTFYDNYLLFTKWVKSTLGLCIDFTDHPELLEIPKFAAFSGAFFWESHGLYTLADRGISETTVGKITNVINKYDGTSGKKARINNAFKIEKMFRSK